MTKTFIITFEVLYHDSKSYFCVFVIVRQRNGMWYPGQNLTICLCSGVVKIQYQLIMEDMYFPGRVSVLNLKRWLENNCLKEHLTRNLEGQLVSVLKSGMGGGSMAVPRPCPSRWREIIFEFQTHKFTILEYFWTFLRHDFSQ